MRDRALLAVGAGAIALSLIGPTVQAAVIGTSGPFWGGYGYGHMNTAMMGEWWDQSPTTEGPAPIEGARDIEITVRDFEIVPREVRVAFGEAVNLTVTNSGAAQHDFSVPDLGIHVVVAPGQTATVGFSASVPGTYDTLCTVPGHAGAGMVGTLVVESS
jgi:plastocyanin